MKQMRLLECSRNKNIDTFIGLICMKLFTLRTSCLTIFMLGVSAVSGGYKHQQIIHPCTATDVTLPHYDSGIYH
jgi:hypothetical protein